MDPPVRVAADPVPSGAGDLAIVRAVLAGEAGSREQLVERLAPLPPMLRKKHQRMGAPLGVHEVEDALQNVLLHLWRKLARYDGRVPLLHWAYGFGVLEILKLVERRLRRREQVGDVPEPLAPAPPGPRAVTERLARLCGELPAQDQEILRQKHFEERTFEEIAGRMHMAVNTVKARYYRALARLRRRLEPGEVSE